MTANNLCWYLKIKGRDTFFYSVGLAGKFLHSINEKLINKLVSFTSQVSKCLAKLENIDKILIIKMHLAQERKRLALFQV